MVPKAARAAIGRAEFTKSLGVTDRRRAEALAYPILAAWKESVDAAVRGESPPAGAPVRPATSDEVDRYIAEQVFDLHRRLYRSFARSAIEDGTATFADERKRLSDRKAMLLRERFVGGTSNRITYTEAELLDAGLALPSDPAQRVEITEQIVQALIDGISGVEAEMDGSGKNFQPSPFIVAAKANSSDASKFDSVMALFERYARQRLAEGAKRADGINQDRIVVRRFAEFIGSGRRISSVTRADVRSWRDTLAKLPRNFSNSKAFKGMDMRSAAAKAEPLHIQPLSATSQNKYLSTVSPLFSWAVTNGYAETNPCDGLFLKLDKQANPYPTLSALEINRIISSPLFIGFQSHGNEHQPGLVFSDDWRKWIPLICLFTGSRIGEVAQLRVEDVRHEHERWFIDIRNDIKTGQRTKSGRSRIIPIHRALEEIGFLAFHQRQVARAKETGDHNLFLELEGNERDQIGAKPSRFWRRYLGKIGVKQGNDGRGAHSFRHTLADELRAGGFLDDQFGPLILGHNRARVTAGYGRLPQGTANMLCSMIDAVQFKGVDFDQLRQLATVEPA